jgi:hypothetical protein
VQLILPAISKKYTLFSLVLIFSTFLLSARSGFIKPYSGEQFDIFNKDIRRSSLGPGTESSRKQNRYARKMEYPINKIQSNFSLS